MSLLTLGLTLYFVAVAAYIVSENRRPQSAFAWLFLFLTLPFGGLVIYILFGRQRGGVGRTRKLVRQNLPGHLDSTLRPQQEEHETAMRVLEAGPTPARRIASLVHVTTGSPVTIANDVEVLQDAEGKYPRLLEDIKAARRSIHLQYYIWRPDALGERLRAILAAKVAEGVDVRIIYDPVGSFGLRMAIYVRRMRRAGIRMVPSSPLWRVHTISYRNHRKIAVIDGRIGYTGGLNIGEEHLRPGGGWRAWRDTHLRLTGSAVRMLQAVFAVDWSNASGEPLLGPEHFPPLEEPARASCRQPVQLVVSGPDSEWRALRQQYFAMITAARHRVRIQTPYFILEDSLAEALKIAAMSGLDVSVMVADGGPDQRVVYWAAHTYLAEIASAGVEVLLHRGGFLHAKTVVTDGEVASVGSGNWDIRSFSINYELNAVIYDPAIAARIEAAYDRDRANCRRFDAERYRAGPPLPRFRDSLARLVSPLL
ncbi:cardiolipin synthetase 2 [Rubellimicrobium thermophilum DSM 16684]|uniref:Cardiolipin synthase n=1 Tax=Rubellimicrobium thermophilum DSM 16684 TaxID=1123069 RepID=S9R2N8_9RHOB|nr:cardiolipin synthase [Rubellimicrobium thermophilum]EPX86238.1 cardiolipin synthetase 2 [Rubellimicrobium thermophilum DSM 16684]